MQETKKPSKLIDILGNILGIIVIIAAVGGIWWFFKNLKDPTPEQECRTMILGEIPYPQGYNPPPRKVFELGCDTMQEFKNIREDMRIEALKKSGALLTAPPSNP